jgi:hypothetical protein
LSRSAVLGTQARQAAADIVAGVARRRGTAGLTAMMDNYEVDAFGVIHQIVFTPITYDKQYISYYEDLSDRTIKLGYQRLGWILGLMGRMPRSVLEIGYGTGTFIEAAQITGVPDCAGYDIAEFPLPQGVRFIGWECCAGKPVGPRRDVRRAGARARPRFPGPAGRTISGGRRPVLPLP